MKIIFNKKNKFLFTIVITALLFQQCCTTNSNQKTMINSELLNEGIKPLPRGIIEATITPNSLEVINNKQICNATINTVHKTGGGIKPIVENTGYSFSINEILRETIGINIGAPIKCQITEIPRLSNTMGSSKYKIIRIIK